MNPRDREPAGDRVVRIMSLCLGIASVVFGLLALPALQAQYAAYRVPWTWTIVGVFFGSGIALAMTSRVFRPSTLRVIAAIMAVSYLVGMATLETALLDGFVSGDLGSPWLLQVSAVGTAAAAIAWRPWVAWSYVGIAVMLLGIDRVLASSQPILDVAYQDALFTLLFDSVFTALALAVYRAARLLDEAAVSAIAETGSAAIADARDRARARVESLVHDTVLVALLASARADDPVLAAREARRALDQIDAFEAEPQDRPALSGREAVWGIQALATELVPDATFGYEIDDELEIPAEVAEAIAEAAAEAIRNSIRHAGVPHRDVSRAVHARVADGRLEIDVLDDGAGFNPDAVAPARLGLAVSVFGRMRAIAGGDALLSSRPGEGTRVTIRWTSAG